MCSCRLDSSGIRRRRDRWADWTEHEAPAVLDHVSRVEHVVRQSVLWLVASELLHLGLTPLMLLATGCFTLVYVLGTGAAVRLA